MQSGDLKLGAGGEGIQFIKASVQAVMCEFFWVTQPRKRIAKTRDRVVHLGNHHSLESPKNKT